MRLRLIVLGAALLGVGGAAAGCARRDTSVVYAQRVPASAARGGAQGGLPARTAVEPRAVVGAVPGSGWRLRTEMRVGNPRGHVQIPKGGQPGTTSLDRPTFDEVGVEAAWGPAVDLSYRRGRHLLHAGAAGWVLHGSETLRQDLVSHEKFYAAGTEIESATELWEAWVGYGYALSVGPCLTLTPGVGVYVSRIDYSISGAGQTSERNFSSISPMLEAELAWRPGGRMHLSADVRLVADEWIGLSSPTNVIELALRAHLDLSSRSALTFAIGATHISHHDEQTVPNDYLLEVLPWFALGGEFRF